MSIIILHCISSFESCPHDDDLCNDKETRPRTNDVGDSYNGDWSENQVTGDLTLNLPHAHGGEDEYWIIEQDCKCTLIVVCPNINNYTIWHHVFPPVPFHISVILIPSFICCWLSGRWTLCVKFESCKWHRGDPQCGIEDNLQPWQPCLHLDVILHDRSDMC